MSFSLAVPPLACAFPQTAVLAFMLRAAQAWTKLLAKERAADWSYIALSNSLVGECSEPSNHAAPRPPHHQRSHQALTGNSQPLALAAAPYFSRFLPARQYCTHLHHRIVPALAMLQPRGHQHQCTGSRQQLPKPSYPTSTLPDCTSPSAPGCSCGPACGLQRWRHSWAIPQTSG